MTAITVTSVFVLDNPAPFSNPLQFDIQYECLYELESDLEWKLTYVGSAESEKYDQVLDSVLVGPVHVGQYRFIFQADPPDASRLPPDDVVGVTALLLTCSYRSKEFLRIGYYVNNDYAEDDPLRENPSEKAVIERLWRNILADKPRVTRFPVEFDAVEAPPEAADMGEDTNPGSMLEGAGMAGQEEGAAVSAAAFNMHPQGFSLGGASVPAPSPGGAGDMDMS